MGSLKPMRPSLDQGAKILWREACVTLYTKGKSNQYISQDAEIVDIEKKSVA